MGCIYSHSPVLLLKICMTVAAPNPSLRPSAVLRVLLRQQCTRTGADPMLMTGKGPNVLGRSLRIQLEC